MENKELSPKLKHLFKFPLTLPNDVEDFTLFYPKKYPLIMEIYSKTVQELYLDPDNFLKKCFELQKELWIGFEKIKSDFEACNNRDLKFLVDTDQRLHKLFCYRFWIINYLWCDGPLHNFYVDKIKEFAEKIAEWSEIEEKEKAVLEIERALLQSDYADLYLERALGGLEVYEIIHSIPEIKEILMKLQEVIVTEENPQKAYVLIEEMMKVVESLDTTEIKKLNKLLCGVRATGKVRGDNLTLYNAIIHPIQFRAETLLLKQRYDIMKTRLKQIFDLAKSNLDLKEYSEFEIISKMSRNLMQAKDIFGEIDPELIPFWFRQVHGEMKRFIPGLEYVSGHAAVFRDIIWSLPPELKVKVMSPDLEAFSLEKL